MSKYKIAKIQHHRAWEVVCVASNAILYLPGHTKQSFEYKSHDPQACKRQFANIYSIVLSFASSYSETDKIS